MYKLKIKLHHCRFYSARFNRILLETGGQKNSLIFGRSAIGMIIWWAIATSRHTNKLFGIGKFIKFVNSFDKNVSFNDKKKGHSEYSLLIIKRITVVPRAKRWSNIIYYVLAEVAVELFQNIVRIPFTFYNVGYSEWTKAMNHARLEISAMKRRLNIWQWCFMIYDLQMRNFKTMQ